MRNLAASHVETDACCACAIAGARKTSTAMHCKQWQKCRPTMRHRKLVEVRPTSAQAAAKKSRKTAKRALNSASGPPRSSCRAKRGHHRKADKHQHTGSRFWHVRRPDQKIRLRDFRITVGVCAGEYRNCCTLRIEPYGVIRV